MKKTVEVHEPDIWRPLADFLTDMIAKYADEMEFEKLPDPDWYLLCRAVREAYRIYTKNRSIRIAGFMDIDLSIK